MKLCLFLVAAAALAAQDRAPVIELNLAESAVTPFADHASHASGTWEYPNHGPGATAHTTGTFFGNFSQDSEPKARRCTAKSTDSTSCPEPTCQAYDWHDKQKAGVPGGSLSCTVVRQLVNADGQANIGPFQSGSSPSNGAGSYAATWHAGSPSPTNKVTSTTGLNWDLRSEWLITYDAEDRAGNKAETAAFTMIMDDRLAPGEGKGKGCGTGIDSTCRFDIPFNTVEASADDVEAVQNCQRFQEIHHTNLHRSAYGVTSATDMVDAAANTQVSTIRTGKPALLLVEDNYDGVDVEDTLQITVTYPTTAHDATTDCEGIGNCCPTFCTGTCSCAAGNSCPTGTKVFDVSGSNSRNVIIDTRCLGTYKITYTVNDFAGIFGENGANNVASKDGYLKVTDDEVPVIHMRNGATSGANTGQDATGSANDLWHECNNEYNDALNFNDGSTGYQISAGAICRDQRDSWKASGAGVVDVVSNSDAKDGTCDSGAALAAEGNLYRNDRPAATWWPNPSDAKVLQLHSDPDDTANAGALNGVICTTYNTNEDSVWGSKHANGTAQTGSVGHGHYVPSTFAGCDGSTGKLFGTNAIKYDCEDARNNPATQVVRQVRVRDTTPPSLGITTVGKQHINRYCDAEEGCGKHEFSADGAGTYNVSGTVYANHTELAANARSFNEHYTIEHTAGYAPDLQFIALLTQEGYGYECKDDCGTWTAAKGDGTSGAVYHAPDTRTVTTWHQGCQCPCDNTPTTTFNSNKPGTYVLRYTCTDSHNNRNTKCRTVKNEDKFKPVLTILGADVMTLEATTTGNYVDDGATCSDVVDGMIPANVEVSGDVVKLANIGEYLVQYNCRDAAGNQAEPLTRTVVVRQSWGAVTAKLDLPKAHHSRDEFVGNEDKEFAIRSAMANKLQAHGVSVAAVKLEVYEWQGTDQHGSCNRITGGRRLLESDTPTENQKDSLGLKLIVAVPDSATAAAVQGVIDNQNFACDLITQVNVELASIVSQQTNACAAVAQVDCDTYDAVSCKWNGSSCVVDADADGNGSADFGGKHLTNLQCDSQCEDINSETDFTPFASKSAKCQAQTTGCFFPNGHGCCFYGGVCKNFGCACDNTDIHGGPTALSAAANPVALGCQNSISCQIHGDNPVTWEAGFAYTDAGAKCADSIDGDTTVDTYGDTTVNVDQTGTYYVTYKSKNSQGTWNYAWDADCCATRRTVYVTDTLKPVIRLDLEGVEVGRSSGAATAWRQPYTGTVHSNPAHFAAGTTFDNPTGTGTADHHHDGPEPNPNPMISTVATSVPAGTFTLMAEVAGASGSWLIAAAAAAVAGVALLAHARKQSHAKISVPV